MSKDDIIVGLDIGTSAVRTVVAQKQSDTNKLMILGVGVAPSGGLNGGIVVDVEEVIKSIVESKEIAERTAGIPIEHAIVSINGSHIFSQFSKGVVAVSRADGEISEDDVARVINAAQAISIPNNKEIINLFPCNYTIDGQEKIKDPVGMNGVRLEVSALVVEGTTPFIKNLYKCVERSGIDVECVVFSTLAAAKAVLTKRQKELGVVVVDIGKGITGVSVYEDGNILLTSVIPIGAGHITNDVAIGLRTTIDVAEKVKLEYGTVQSSEIGKCEKINLSEFDENEEGEYSRKYLAEIVEARVDEIFSMVDDELKKIEKSGMLPSGVIITGGGAKLPGIISLAKKALRLPAQIGYPKEMDGIVDRVDDPSFATAVGLILWESDENGYFQSSSGSIMDKISIEKVGKKIRKIFKTLLP